MSRLHDLLVANDKKKIFKFNSNAAIGYPSGLLPLDFQNGYTVIVNNKKDPKKIPNEWNNIGIQGGTFCTIIGNTGTGKTALAIKIGSAMVRNFDQGDVYHIDAEGNSNETWIRQLNGYTPEEYEDKYHLLDEQYVDKLFTQVVQMCEMKINDKACYYDTGRYSERGEKIITPQPTVIIIDSLPSLQTTEVEDNTKLDTQTYNMRLAKAHGEFYKRLRPMIQKANITIIAINHIKEKPQMGFLTTQAKIQGCSPNESIPGGTGPLYYAQTLLRLKYRGKYTMEKHNFNGFLVEVEFLKSKTNASHHKVEIVFNERHGFDSWLTLLHLANNIGVVKGRNPYSYFDSDPELKFNSKEFNTLIEDNEKLRAALFNSLSPYFISMLKGNKPSKEIDNTELTNKLMNLDYSNNFDNVVLEGE